MKGPGYDSRCPRSFLQDVGLYESRCAGDEVACFPKKELTAPEFWRSPLPLRAAVWQLVPIQTRVPPPPWVGVLVWHGGRFCWWYRTRSGGDEILIIHPWCVSPSLPPPPLVSTKVYIPMHPSFHTEGTISFTDCRSCRVNV